MFRATLSAVATTAAALFTLSAPASAELTGDQQKCVATMNKDLRLVAKAVLGELQGCIHDRAIGKSTAGVRDCIAADAGGRIDKARQKTLADESSLCTGNDKDGNPKAPAVLFTGGASVAGFAEAEVDRMIDILLGSDPDAAVLAADTSADGAKCQQAIGSDLAKCARARLTQFFKCKKRALKDGADSAAAIEPCVFTDPNGKVAAACDDATAPDTIRTDLEQLCVGKAQDLCVVFPQCCPPCAASDISCIHGCLENRVACEHCATVESADDLGSDCDLLDDAADNQSCGCGDGLVQPREECDDENLADNDGCSTLCRIERCGDGIVQASEQCESNPQCSGGKQCSSCLCQCTVGLTDCAGVCRNLFTDEANCGTCGNTCTNAHGSTLCSSGHCTPSCTFPFDSCDGDPDNGCETSATTLSDCGSCDTPCALANASETCSTGACTISSCSSGFANCDGSQSTGCERQINSCASGCCTGTNVGSYVGDDAGCTLRATRNGTNETCFAGAVAEDNSGCANPTVILALQVPAGMDFDLYVSPADGASCEHWDGTSWQPGCNGQRLTGLTEFVRIFSEESCPFGFGDPADQSFGYSAEVRWFSGSQCASWTFTVQSGAGC